MTGVDRLLVLDSGDKVGYREFSNDSEKAQLIMLPGIGNTRNMWGDVPLALKEHRRVVVFDVPGFGLSSTPSTGFSVSSVCNNLHEAIATVASGPRIVVGHSLGGLVSLALVAGGLEAVGLALVAGYPHTAVKILRSPTFGLSNLVVGFNLAAQLLGGALPLDRRARQILLASSVVRSILLHPFAAHPDRLDPAKLVEALEGTGSLNSLRVAFHADDIDPKSALGNFAGNVALMIGEHDYLHAAADLAQFENEAGRELTVLPGLGHWPQLEDPVRLAAAIDAFANEVG